MYDARAIQEAVSQIINDNLGTLSTALVTSCQRAIRGRPVNMPQAADRWPLCYVYMIADDEDYSELGAGERRLIHGSLGIMCGAKTAMNVTTSGDEGYDAACQQSMLLANAVRGIFRKQAYQTLVATTTTTTPPVLHARPGRVEYHHQPEGAEPSTYFAATLVNIEFDALDT